MNTPEKKAEASAKIDAYMMSRVGLSFGSLHGSGGKAPPKPPSLAAGKFIEVLEKEIQSHVGNQYLKLAGFHSSFCDLEKVI